MTTLQSICLLKKKRDKDLYTGGGGYIFRRLVLTGQTKAGLFGETKGAIVEELHREWEERKEREQR